MASVPDHRSYEVVSPADKNGGDVVGDGQTVVAADHGGAVAYASRVAFGDTRGSGIAGLTQYVARRSSVGWSTQAITPTPDQGTFQVLTFPTVIPWFSGDLGKALVFAYDLPQVSGDAPKVPNVYEEDVASGQLTPLSVSSADPISIFTFLSASPWAASADLSHVALVSSDRLLPDAPAGMPTVYEWVNGALRVASILPDGSVASDGADIQPRPYRDAISTDGSRVVFIAHTFGTPQLYVRIDGTRTDWVSQPEASVDPGDPATVELQMVSDDGRHIFFTTTSRLVDQDANDGPDLYRWDETANPATDSNLTLISNSGDVNGDFDGTAVVGASQDGSRVYYQDQSSRLWLWDHGRTTLISNNVPRSYGFTEGTRLGVTDDGPGASRVTPDGSYLAFISNGTQNTDNVHGLTGTVTNGHLEMYLYHAEDNTLTCVSCPQGRDATSDVTVVPRATAATATLFLNGSRPRYLSADGHRLLFTTTEALLPEDVNGLADVYEYNSETRTLSLISTGQGSNGAWFSDASTSGDDVFFVTREQLAKQDRDSLVDLYDARVGGGLPDAPATLAPCDGDVCQGAPAVAPGSPSLASESFVGSGSARRAGLLVKGARLVRGTHGRLVVRVPSGGVLSWGARGIKHGTRTVYGGRSYVVQAVLAPYARSQLKRKGAYRVTLTLTFRSHSGATVRTRVPLTFKATSLRKGR